MFDKNCVSVKPSPSKIRLIGDPILHQPGIVFPAQFTESEYQELLRQIQIAKTLLIKTGGGGIAANQCAQIQQPYQFAIVGVFYESEEHVAGVQKRYPTVLFPEALIMVNPVVLERSQTTQAFNHGCLSVPCPNRCTVESPQEMTVEYLNPLANMDTTISVLKDKAAVALWHEMNHILDGKTYIDTALASLDEKDLHTFKSLVESECNRRQPNQVVSELINPPFYVSITLDEDKNPQLNEKVLNEVLAKMTLGTLIGIKERCSLLVELLSDAKSNFFK